MSGFDAVRRRRLQTRRAAVVGALTVVAGLLVTTVASPPSSQEPTDVQGRTWIPVVTDEGPQLVLVNGISGLIEARATTVEPQPEGVQVVGSTVDRTVLGSADALTVVDNGLHVAVSRTGVPGSTAALVGDRVLTLGEGRVELRDADLDADAVEVPVRATPVSEVAPVVDDDGTAWFLGDDDGDIRAFGVTADVGSATDLDEHDVADSATALIVVDGTTHVSGPDGTIPVTGGDTKPEVASSSTLPSVAVDTDGLWAAADRRDLTLVGEDEDRVRLDDAVTDLAIWNGSVVAATEGGAVVVSESGDVEPIDALDDQVSFHTAGGLLWLTSRSTVVAIWPDHTQVPFELTAVDVDLCIGTCGPDDVSRFLEDQPVDTEEPDASSTTQPPRQLEPPSVEPTVPTTTAPPTTSTAPDRPSTTEGPVPSTTSVPSSTTSEVIGSPGTGPTTSEVDGPEPGPADPDPDPEPEPEPDPPTWPSLPEPPEPTTTLAPPPTSPPAPTTTTAPPPGEIHLILELAPSSTSTEVSLGLLGSRRDCRGAGLGGVNVALGWSGAADGRREVRVPWRGGDSDIVDFTIEHAGGGNLTVTMEACGLSATRTASIPGEFPDISGISLDPRDPRPGQSVTARVTWDLPQGWQVTSTAWSGGLCGSTVPVGDTSPRPEQRFDAEEGRFCVSVIVTLAPPDGGSRNEERAVEIGVDGTTTTPPDTTSSTSTTAPPATTSTTTPPAPTTEPPATTTTTEPPEGPP